jgi:hypothetical protein
MTPASTKSFGRPILHTVRGRTQMQDEGIVVHHRPFFGYSGSADLTFEGTAKCIAR